jgi:putative endonuclease
MNINKHKTTTAHGKEGEDFVCRELQKKGFLIIHRNVREKYSEIDIVARDKKTLVFIEVRTRANSTLGHPAETISLSKQNKIRRAAQAYLIKNKISNTEIRFDVATIIWESELFEYFSNAF